MKSKNNKFREEEDKENIVELDEKLSYEGPDTLNDGMPKEFVVPSKIDS